MTPEPVMRTGTSTPRHSPAAPHVHPCTAAAGTLPPDYLGASCIHVALTLGRLLAVGHEPIIGCWPSLLVVTSTASLQLDPAADLSRDEVAHMSSQLLTEITRWHASLQCHDNTPL